MPCSLSFESFLAGNLCVLIDSIFWLWCEFGWLLVGFWGRYCDFGSGGVWKWEVRSQRVHASFHNLWFPLQPCVTCIPWEHSSSSQGTRPQSWNPENGKEMGKKPCVFAAVGLGGLLALLSKDNDFVKSCSYLGGDSYAVSKTWIEAEGRYSLPLGNNTFLLNSA